VASRYQPIVPAVLTFRADGALFSERFDDVYASSAGALAQARHVFLAGNGLPQRWAAADRFTVVETGFGAGLNFLVTWQAWREDASAQARLHFVSVEKHPFAVADLARIHERCPQVEPLARALREGYPSLVPGFHRLHLDGGRVTLTLLFGEAAAMLQQLEARTDAFYLDGFAPARNPDMWNDRVFAELARLARPGATAATYSVAGPVRDGLARAGFVTDRRAGFASKREMLVAQYPGQHAEPSPRRQRRALVVGAGLAGTACAERLAQRGWEVQVLERHQAPAQEASGNPAGLMRPVFSPDWNTHSRFTVASYLYASRHHAGLARQGAPVRAGEGGVLQLARDATQFDKQQRMLDQFALPAELAQRVDVAQATELAGTVTAGPGLWFPRASWVSPASLCGASLQAGAAGIQTRFGVAVADLREDGGEWMALDAGGRRLAAAPVVILANAHLARALRPAAHLPLRAVRGQVSLFPAPDAAGPRIAVCREGYVTPAIDGVHCLGASFNEGVFEEHPRSEDHAANLQRLTRMLPDFGAGLDAAAFAGRVAFRAMSPDRLPVLGQINAQPGLYACLALGSRGMTWSALAAELVASRIDGDPCPLERDLVAALSPDRFGVKLA
jgi:tRNA 5-methylaminomethyl-2-thiouridine biosynthesis bifunctional protein